MKLPVSVCKSLPPKTHVHMGDGASRCVWGGGVPARKGKPEKVSSWQPGGGALLSAGGMKGASGHRKREVRAHGPSGREAWVGSPFPGSLLAIENRGTAGGNRAGYIAGGRSSQRQLVSTLP